MLLILIYCQCIACSTWVSPVADYTLQWGYDSLLLSHGKAILIIDRTIGSVWVWSMEQKELPAQSQRGHNSGNRFEIGIDSQINCIMY